MKVKALVQIKVGDKVRKQGEIFEVDEKIGKKLCSGQHLCKDMTEEKPVKVADKPAEKTAEK